jgi:hypothetical protein
MNSHSGLPDIPGNRQSGIPSNARFAGAGVVFSIIFIMINTVALLSGNNDNKYFDIAYDILFPLLFAALFPACLISTGKLIFVKALRKTAVILTIIYTGMVLWDFILIAIYPFSQVGLAATGGPFLLLFSPLQYLMWRDFRRSRWLDPTSLPHEWEIAAIRDPNSINYHPPKPTNKKPSETKKHHR